MKNTRIDLEDIISFLDNRLLSVKGKVEDVYVDNVSDAEHVTATTLDWINRSKQNKQAIAEDSKAKVIITDPSIEYTETIAEQGKVIIMVDNPRKEIAMVIDHFFLERPVPGVHPSATISHEAVIEEGTFIAAGCVIGKAKIGKACIINSNVVIYDNCELGDNCIIQAGTVIGTDGLGCMREEDGTLVKFPHLGGVKIGNNVEIGANCQIAKGVLSDTIIGNGCKINGLCFIAHNCVLEENVWITGDTMLCGTVHVGRNATIFSNVIVRDQRMIGAGATIGMGAVVTKNVPDGETWLGNPAKKLDK